jgi:hypothetical protein
VKWCDRARDIPPKGSSHAKAQAAGSQRKRCNFGFGASTRVRRDDGIECPHSGHWASRAAVFTLARLIFCFSGVNLSVLGLALFVHGSDMPRDSLCIRLVGGPRATPPRLLWKSLHTTPELSPVPLIASTFAGSGFFLSRVGSTACSRWLIRVRRFSSPVSKILRNSALALIACS